ncbi:MAG: hypothetical protein GY796_07955 [Chloroflexi bacterium]|nr:hypothetical protein [Chloroflexota bacterium]
MHRKTLSRLKQGVVFVGETAVSPTNLKHNSSQTKQQALNEMFRSRVTLNELL